MLTGGIRRKELKLRFILFALTFHYLCIRQDAARQKELKLRFILFALTFHYLCIIQAGLSERRLKNIELSWQKRK